MKFDKFDKCDEFDKSDFQLCQIMSNVWQMLLIPLVLLLHIHLIRSPADMLEPERSFTRLVEDGTDRH